MQISKEELNKFISLFEKNSGITLTEDDAQNYAKEIIQLVSLLIKPDIGVN